MQKIDAVVAHAIPGRIRLRIPAKKEDRGFFEEVFEKLKERTGIEKLTINPATASILIHYDQTNKSDLDGFLENNSFFSVQSDAPETASGTQAVDEAFADIRRLLETSTVAEVNIQQTVALGLIGLSCYQLLKGNFKMPTWYVALWYAYNLYRDGMDKQKHAQDDEPEGVEATQK